MAGGAAGGALLESDGEVGAAGAYGGPERDGHGGGDGEGRGVGEDAPIGVDIEIDADRAGGGALDRRGDGGANRDAGPQGEEQSGDSAERPDDEIFGAQLAHQTAAGRAHGEADGELAAAPGVGGEEQVDEIDGADEEDHRHRHGEHLADRLEARELAGIELEEGRGARTDTRLLAV